MISKTIIILALFTTTVALFVQLSVRYDPELVVYWTLGAYALLVIIYLWVTRNERVYFDDQD